MLAPRRGFRLWIVLACWLAACGDPAPRPGDATPPAGTADAGWPLDGFLHYLPTEWATVVRLPSADAAAAHPDDVAALLRQWGFPADDAGALLFCAQDPEGLDRTQGVGLAMDATGAWSQYLPAADKGALNQSLRASATDRVFREEGSWLVLSDRAPRGPSETGEPLPPGDLAFRVRYHALLRALADLGDVLTGTVTLGGAGLEARARLVPGPASATRDALTAARAASVPGLLDYIPASAGMRLETTLPPTVFAPLLTRGIAVHSGMAADSDREILERLLRELLTGVDRDTGLAVGLEFSEGELTVVFVGRIAQGPPSSILAAMQRPERITYGAVVLDPRDDAPDLVAKGAWVIGAEPSTDGCPASALGLVVGLAGGESAPLPMSWKSAGDWFVLGAGPHADHLVRATLIRLTRAGANRTEASNQLLSIREKSEHAARPYVLGFVADTDALTHLEEADAKALRAQFGMLESAPAPHLLAVAGFLDAGALLLDGRLLYTPRS